MSDFKRGGGRDFGGRDNRGGFDKPELHKATCASCGNSCEVPFKPNGIKPVYCRDCFKKEGGGDARPMRSEGGGFGGRDSRGFEEKKMYSAVCEKCGNNCEVPFRPTGEKPVYCRPCFGKPGGNDRFSAGPSNRGADQNGDQFKAINAKLDTLIKLLTPASKAVVEEKVAPKEKEAPKKADKKKAAAKKKK